MTHATQNLKHVCESCSLQNRDDDYDDVDDDDDDEDDVGSAAKGTATGYSYLDGGRVP